MSDGLDWVLCGKYPDCPEIKVGNRGANQLAMEDSAIMHRLSDEDRQILESLTIAIKELAAAIYIGGNAVDARR